MKRTSLGAASISGVILMALVGVLLGAAPALAKVATTPANWAFVDISVQYDTGAPYVLAGGQLATATPIPSPVVMAIPTSSTPQWVGEVFPGDPSSDHQLPYEISKADSMDIYHFTMQKSRYGQVEALVPGLIKVNGDNYVVDIAWTSTMAVPRVRIATVLPPNAVVTKAAEGAQTASDASGNKYYYRENTNVRQGDKLTLSFTYNIPTGGTSSSNSTNGNSVLWIVLGIGVVVAIVLVVIISTQRGRSVSGDDDETAEEPTAEEDDTDEE